LTNKTLDYVGNKMQSCHFCQHIYSGMLYTVAMTNKQFLMLSGGIAIALAALFTTMSLQEILAQETNSTLSNQTRMGIPQLNGSVNVQQQTNQFIRDNLRVPFATALETAQAEVENGTAISGRVGVVQGYLVYIFKVANFDAETSRIVIVDAGNGSVLYTSEDMPLHNGGLGGYGCGGGGHHKGFGNHWDNYDRGTTSDNGGGGGESSRSGMVVVSPVIGV
jgi:uncharacterized membrane protein YkoI